MNKCLYICLSIYILISSCNTNSKEIAKDKVLQNIPFSQALDSAKKHNKMLWVVIGDGNNCGHTNEFIKTLSKLRFFTKYNDHFIFYTCDISKPENEKYYFMLLPQTMPNSYIFSKTGEILSNHIPANDLIDFAQTQAEKATKGDFTNPNFTAMYFSVGKKMLNAINLHIRAANLIQVQDSLEVAEDILKNKIHSKDRIYYFYYLMYELGVKTNDTTMRNIYADSAYTFSLNAKNPILYANINDRVKQHSSYYKNITREAPYIYTKNNQIDYGNIQLGESAIKYIEIQNRGNTPLVLFDHYTSCNCIDVELSREPIKPYHSSEIKITYHANVKGDFKKSILLKSNAIDMFKISVSGKIK